MGYSRRNCVVPMPRFANWDVFNDYLEDQCRKRQADILRGHKISIDVLQADLDEWLHHYNQERTHQGKMCCGRTPIETMIDGKEIWQEKFVN